MFCYSINSFPTPVIAFATFHSFAAEILHRNCISKTHESRTGLRFPFNLSPSPGISRSASLGSTWVMSHLSSPSPLWRPASSGTSGSSPCIKRALVMADWRLGSAQSDNDVVVVPPHRGLNFSSNGPVMSPPPFGGRDHYYPEVSLWGGGLGFFYRWKSPSLPISQRN